VQTALEWDSDAGGGHDVYFGVGLRRPGLTRRQRGTADQVLAVPGFWADLDIARPGLPPLVAGEYRRATDRDEAFDIIRTALPLAPSLVISSGWGLHCYWIAKELVRFDELPGGRDRWVNAHRRWNAALVQEGRRRSVKVDDVSDVTRVLRVPGTRNHKVAGDLRPVELLETVVTHSPSDHA